MRRLFISVLFILVLINLSVSLAGFERKNIGVMGSAGTAASDFSGSFFDVGMEIRTLGNFYLQFLFDYYLEPTGIKTDGVGSSSYGFNLYGVYKFKLSKRFHLFTKIGVNYTTLKASVSPLNVSSSNSDFGAGGGVGFEFHLNKNIGILLGGTMKAIVSENGVGTWFKIYSGILFRF